ncbi:MAG: TlpA disulfide reductase family protein [Meiothermus sp.]|nr:TlpA disulfide reductase family protein [Meiothermus sp.]
MPEVLNIGPFMVATVRLLLLGGLLLASWWGTRAARGAGLDGQWVGNIVFNTVVTGVLGARLGFALLNWEGYRDAPLTVLYLWQPGYLPWAGVLSGLGYGMWALWHRPKSKRVGYVRPLLLGFAAGGALFTLGYSLLGLRTGDPTTVKLGDPAPEVRLVDLQGQPVTLSSLRGKAVVLNFWATWCPPCRREMPLLDSVQAEFKARGLVVVGVDLNEDPRTVAAYIRQAGVSYPIWLDAPPGQAGFDRTQALYTRFGGVGLPTTVFIAPDGTVRARQVGELSRANLTSIIRAMLP